MYDESKGTLNSLKVSLHLHVPSEKSRFRLFRNGVMVRNFETKKEEFIARRKNHVYDVKLCNVYCDRIIIMVNKRKRMR